ncbi:protein kinase [Amycolatopsis sp. GM8]|uniref:serine/threonine protein kinase n=1 Tax=Amycolatopsis sp. GM8 TaxID=2896530 RepID=UPI001F02469D|nr:protein kinase [Amycolatopsis sp. GM8]
MSAVEEHVRQLADTGAKVTISGEPVAHGPVATVYSVLRDGKPVILKVFPAKLDRKTLAAVEREQQQLRALAASAPILPAEAVEQTGDGRHALRMTRYAQSLTGLVEQVGALPPEDVVVLGYALALALSAAHEARILHGGISPDNVLFHASGEPVLADFGVPLREAFPRDPLHAIECVPPETLRTGIVDERTDLYGLGAVLHYALTGSSPHPGKLGEQPGERVLRVLRSPVPAINRADVPIGLSTVVARLLAPDAANRPSGAAWVAEQLAGMLPADPSPSISGAAPVAPEFDDFVVPADDPVQRPTRSRRPYFLAGAAVVAAGLVGAAVLLAQQGSGELHTTPRLPPPPAQETPSSAAAPVRLNLADPVDLGNQAQLSWTVEGEQVLDYAVIVAGEGEPNRTLLAQRNHSLTVPIDPVRKYCFELQATDSNQVWTAPPKAIRGATCHQ